MAKPTIPEIIAWVKDRTQLGQPLHEISELIALLEEHDKKPTPVAAPTPKAAPKPAPAPVQKKK